MSELDDAQEASGRVAEHGGGEDTWLPVAGVGLTVVLLAGYLTYNSLGEDQDPPDQPRTLQRVTEENLPLAEAPDAGEVVVLEQGATEVTDSSGQAQASWGVTVENTSETMVAHVSLRVVLLDGDGESLESEADHANVGFVHPGQVSGTGHITYLDAPGLDGIDVEIDEVQWWPERSPGVVGMRVDDVAAWTEEDDSAPAWDEERGSDEEFGDGDTYVQFHLKSDGYVPHPAAGVIFRNIDGDIVGGSGNDLDAYAEFPPGWSLQRVRVSYGPPEDAVPENTEVHAHA